MHSASRLGFFCLFTALLTCTATRAAQKPNASPIEFLYGDGELFPSMLVSLADKCRFTPHFGMELEESPAPPAPGAQPAPPPPPPDPPDDILGDPTGVISMRITAPRADCPVRVTLSETSLFAASTVSGELKIAGKEYHVAPTIRWDHERLARLKQPIANFVITATVEIDGVAHAHTAKAVVHSVNDWLLRYKLRGESQWVYSGKFLIAAYVNENNPLIDREITRTAIAEKYVDAFRGYTGGSAKDDIAARVNPQEIEGVYRALQKLGFKYAALSQASYTSTPTLAQARVFAQAVRLTNDTLASRQANGVEGAALLASVYRKLGLQVVLILVNDANANRSRCVLGIAETNTMNDWDRLNLNLMVFLDPELIGSAPYAVAVAKGRELFEQHKQRLIPLPANAKSAERVRRMADEGNGFLWIELREARASGVLPIPEF